MRVLFATLSAAACLALASFTTPAAAAAEIPEVEITQSLCDRIVELERAEAVANPTPSDDERQRVRRCCKELRELDPRSVAGRAELLRCVSDEGELAYLRHEALSLWVAGESERLSGLDAANEQDRAELARRFCDGDSPNAFKQAALERLRAAGVQDERVQRAALASIRIDADPYLCGDAVQALRRLGVSAEEATPVLIQAVDDLRQRSYSRCSSETVSDVAIVALGQYGPDAAAAVSRLAWEVDPANSRRPSFAEARRSLGQIAPSQFPYYVEGDEGVPLMIAELASDVRGRRREACRRLFKLREFAKPAAPALRASLGDRNEEVRIHAAVALLVVEPDVAATEILSSYLHSDLEEDRLRLLTHLLESDLHLDRDLLLVEYLNDPSDRLRGVAAAALAKQPQHESLAVEVIAQMCRDESSSTQFRAIEACRKLTVEQLEPLRPLLEAIAKNPGNAALSAQRLLERRFPAEVRTAAVN